MILLGSWAASTASYAQEPNTEPSMSRRQVANCMSHRMAADRSLSFNDAAKICKDQAKSRKADTAANVAPKSVG